MIWVKLISTTVAVCYVVFGLLLYRLQSSFLYYPTLPLENHTLTELDIATEKGITIKVLAVNRGKQDAVFYFGGNAEKVGHDADDLLKVMPNKTLYFVNYRGYGGSLGIPNELGLYSDALKLYDEFKPQHNNIAVIGRSLGTGVTTYLASEREISQIVLITPYDSIENIAQQKYSFYPVSWMLNDKYNSLGRVDKIKADILILLAENDHITPSWSSDNLINALSKDQYEVFQLADTDHITISHQQEYYQRIGKFL